MKGSGNHDEINFDPVMMNHLVEQRIWDGAEVNFTHNHPDNTIFSPEDVQSFENLESHSLRAVLPDGTTYTLTRNQPISTHEWVFDPKTGEMELKWEPKKIAPEYEREYAKVYDKPYMEIRSMPRGPEKQARLVELDAQVSRHMDGWLRSNATKYGYKYRRDGA